MNVPIDGYKYDLWQPEGEIFIVGIAKDSKKFLSWTICEYLPEPDPAATIENRVNKVKMWNIHCRDAHRRQGLASKVIKMLQESHNAIETNAEILTGPGAQLCLKNGFKHIKSLHKNTEDIYLWTKEK